MLRRRLIFRLDLSRNSLSLTGTGETVPGAVPKREGKKKSFHDINNN